MRKEKLLKVGNIILNVYGFILCFMCIVVAIRKENAIFPVLLAVLVCPCSYWFLRKKWGERKPILTRIIRGIVLGLSLLAFGFVLLATPYFRCFSFAVTREAKEYFQQHIQTDEIEYKEVSRIRKMEYGDYQEVTATVEYEDRHTHQTMQRDIILYFDRYDNIYFETFEEMRQYRKENPRWVMSHFNEKELNERIYEVTGYLAEGNYDGIWPLLDEECKAGLTKEKREAQQQKIAPLGAYKQISNIVVPLVEEDESGKQAMTVLVTVKFADGEAEVELVVDEELMVTSMEIK